MCTGVVSCVVSVNATWKKYVEGTDEWLAADALAHIRAQLPAIADACVDAIQAEVPPYARPLEGEFGRGIRLGTAIALRRFIGDEQDGEPDDVYRRLGGGEYRAGRSLDALQAAYRVGARVAWREISDVAAEAGASARAQRNLAEAMFAYIDRLAGESVEGFAEAQLSDAGDLDRRRAELAELLLGGAAGEAELARAAEEARWPLPRTIACLAVAGEQAGRARHRLSGQALAAGSGDVRGVLVPDPAGLERECERIAERLGVRVGIGPAVAAARAGESMRLARRALELTAPDQPVVLAERRLADIALHDAPEIVAALREQLLAPMQGLTPASRARLEATLLQWLRHRGAQGAIAAELGVHPQTVRYRMARVRDLMGDGVLEDPEQRFALEMALRGG